MNEASRARDLRAETENPGVFVNLDEASRDAAIQALGQTDAAIARADDLVAAIAGAALKAVVQARVEQIVKHGYTTEDDAMLSIVYLPAQVRRMAVAADEAAKVTGRDRDLAVVRRRLAACAALCMAAIDRLDIAEPDEGAGR